MNSLNFPPTCLHVICIPHPSSPPFHFSKEHFSSHLILVLSSLDSSKTTFHWTSPFLLNFLSLSVKQWSCVPSLQRILQLQNSLWLSFLLTPSSQFSSLREQPVFTVSTSLSPIPSSIPCGLGSVLTIQPKLCLLRSPMTSLLLNIIFILWTHVLVWHCWFVSPGNCLNIFLDLFLHLVFLLLLNLLLPLVS